MKKILFIGKINQMVKDINAYLEQHFQVQLCSLDREVAAGMMEVAKPDIILVSLIGMMDIDSGIFYDLAEQGTIPVLTIGTEKERDRFLKFYEGNQFENLIRPLGNKDLLDAITRKLKLDQEQSSEEKEDARNEGKKKLLIIDDEAATLRSIKVMLEDSYEVSIAVSAAKAMTMMGKKRPDIILLDYEMPVCDGRQTLEMIRSNDELADIPVIFLTSVNDRGHIEAVLGLRPSGYILKPASRTRIKEEIERALRC